MPAIKTLRGHVAIRLIQECALGVRSEEELAAEFGVTGPAIHYFKERNAAAIAEARQNIENKVAGLWISKLHNRLAELQADVELTNEWLETAESAVDRDRYLQRKHRALRDAAEQLGELAPRQINVGTTVRYEIVGVDLDKLA